MKRILPLLVIALAMLTAGGAHAQEEEARARVQRGIELFDEGNYRLALVELERAYEILPSAKVLYNIGQVHLQLGQYAAAQKALRTYLEDPEIPAERRAEVEKDLAMIATRVATITVESNVPNAEVTINDQPAGRTPLRAVIDAGDSRVVVSLAGYEPRSETLKLAGGDTRAVRVELSKRETVIVTNTRDEGLPPIAVGGWIVTGVLAAGAIGTGIGALAAQSRFETMRESPIAGSPEQAAADIDKQASLSDGLALTTDVLIAATILAGGVSLYFTLRGKPKPAVTAVTW
jgi:hypothetical protein